MFSLSVFSWNLDDAAYAAFGERMVSAVAMERTAAADLLKICLREVCWWREVSVLFMSILTGFEKAFASRSPPAIAAVHERNIVFTFIFRSN